jgi:hypothetical protein
VPDLGVIEMTREADGTTTVGRCDPVVGISLDLVKDAFLAGTIRFDERTNTLRIADQVDYRQVGFQGPFWVCEYVGRVAA